MLRRIWNFLKRNRGKLLIGSFVIGGAVLYYRRLRPLDIVATKGTLLKHEHFEINQRTCNVTVLMFVPRLREVLHELLNTDALLARLRAGVEDKVDCWNQLKIVVFVRLLVAAYAAAFLVLLVRLQMNMLAGLTFLQQQQPLIDVDSQRALYFKIVENALSTGVTLLRQLVWNAVVQSMSSVSLKSRFSVPNDICWRLTEIERQADVGADLYTSLVCAVCEHDPPECRTAQDADLVELLRDSKQILLSGDTRRVFAQLVTTATEHVVRQCTAAAAQVAAAGGAQGDGCAAQPVGAPSLPLAKLIPIMADVSTQALADPPNQLIQRLCLCQDLHRLGANVYESYSLPWRCHSDSSDADGRV